MNKFTSIAGAAALAIAVSGVAATPSSADPAGAAIGAGLAGGILGFMAGAAVAGAPHQHVYVEDGYDAGPDYDVRDHVRACFHAYRSYDLDTDTYVGIDGYRHQCDL